MVRRTQKAAHSATYALSDVNSVEKGAADAAASSAKRCRRIRRRSREPGRRPWLALLLVAPPGKRGGVPDP